MTNSIDRMTIRAKLLGVLLQDARHRAGKSQEACAHLLSVAQSAYEAFEYGDQSPSLPELELLAEFFDVPLAHFWGRSLISAGTSTAQSADRQTLIMVRNKKIGATLRKTRMEARLELSQVAEQAGISPEALEACEYGDLALGVPQLETLAGALQTSIHSLVEAVERPASQQQGEGKLAPWLTSLSPDLLEFISKPVNRPYLDLAYRLSEMSVDRLRAVGEGILEITF